MDSKLVEGMWQHLHTLVIVESTGSYTAAATRLGLSKGAVSQRIAEAERAMVLERFYRGSSSEGVAGCGLGLPIAFEIAARHGARLFIADGPQGKGTRIEVVFAAQPGCLTPR